MVVSGRLLEVVEHPVVLRRWPVLLVDHPKPKRKLLGLLEVHPLIRGQKSPAAVRVLKPNIPNWSVKQIEKLLAEKIADKGGSVRKAFQRYDEDRTGELTYPEMRRASSLGLTKN